MMALLKVWALTVSLGAAPAPAPTLLRIEERDLDGASHAVGPGVAIVDISSTLNIGVDHAALLERIRASEPGTSSQELIEELLQLQSFLNEGAGAGLKPLEEALSEWAREGGTPAANAKLQGAYRQWGRSSLQVMEYANRALSGGDPRRARLREALNVALERNAGASIEQLYATITQVGTEEARRLRGELEEVLREEGVSVQMGAWVTTRGEGSRPIHLPNFDTYAPQGRVDIERFKILLTEEQKAQLRQADQLARDIQSRGFSGALGPEARERLAQLFSSTRACVGALREQLDAFLRGTDPTTQRLRAAAETTRAQLESYGLFMDGLAAKYRAPPSTTSSADFLIGTNEDLDEAARRTRQSVEQFSVLLTALNAQAAALDEVGRRLQKQLTECRQTFTTDVGSVLQTLTSVFQTLAGAQSTSTAALELGAQVLRLALEDLPESTTLDLADAGRRAAGDTVVLKFALRRGERPAQELEVRQLQMQRVLVHLETVVGLIFAQQPRDMGGSSTSRFQVAPAYSVLFKGASRTSGFWNNVLTPGIGANLSALDFDKDGTPELGAAVTLALFRDFVQVGYGYNVFRDRGYLFFGVGLPLPVLGFSAGASGAASAASVP